MYIRMLKNPLSYGLKFDARESDPALRMARYDLVCDAAKKLDQHRMLRFDPKYVNHTWNTTCCTAE